jgi:hypothetical protein
MRVCSARIDPYEEEVMQSISTPLDENVIAAKAYELWSAKGYPDGTAEQDWYEALSHLRSTTAKTAPSAAPARSTPPASPAIASIASTAPTFSASAASAKPAPTSIPARAKAKAAKAR